MGFVFPFTSSKQSKVDPKHSPKLRIESDATFDSKKEEHVMSAKLTEQGAVASAMIFTVTNIGANSIFKFRDWLGPYIGDEVRFVMPEAQDITIKPSKKRLLCVGESFLQYLILKFVFWNC